MNNTYTVLFIGGPWDGVRKNNFKHNTYCVPISQTIVVDRDPNSVTVHQLFTYKRVKLILENNEFFFMVSHSEESRSSIMEKLFQHYQPPKENL